MALFDQWLERRRGFQLIWAIGMVFFAIARAARHIGALIGWNDAALPHLVPDRRCVHRRRGSASGTAYLLGKTRFGYMYAALVLLGGFLAFVARSRYPDAGSLPVLLLIAALVVALAIAVETYFQNERWPQIAALALVAGQRRGGVSSPSPCPSARAGSPSIRARMSRPETRSLAASG